MVSKISQLFSPNIYNINNIFMFWGDENNAAEYKKAKDFTKAVKEFTVGIHDPSVPANLRGEGIKVKTGYETTIMVCWCDILSFKLR